MIKKNPFQKVQASVFESMEIKDKGLEPQDYTTVECLCLGMQIVNSVTVKNNVTNENDPMLAVVVQVAIPVDPKSMQNALITPDGLTNKFVQACPIAPTVRVAIHKDFLVESLQDEDTDRCVEIPPKTEGAIKSMDDVLKDLGLE